MTHFRRKEMVYLASERATYAPRPIMPRPEAVRWRARKVGLDLSLRSRGVERETTKRSAAVLRVTERMPSVANCRKMWPRSGAMNCGMKERKKRAVFGLSASVRTPCLKAAGAAGRKALREKR